MEDIELKSLYEPFEGYLIQWFLEDQELELYQRESVFVSSELYEYCGANSFKSSEEPVARPEAIPEESSRIRVSNGAFPKTFEVKKQAAEMVSPVIADQCISSKEIEDIIISDSFLNRIRYSDSKTVYVAVSSGSSNLGKMKDWAELESNLRSSESGLSTQPGDPEYSGPLFAYNIDADKSADHIEEDDLLELRSPINNSWNQNTGYNPGSAASQMKSNGWNGFASQNPGITDDRFVIVEFPNRLMLDSQSAQSGKQIGVIPTEQWHVRLFSIPDPMDLVHSIAGQAHRDPLHHNKGIKTHGWRFEDSRIEVVDDWKSYGCSAKTEKIGNQDGFQSSKGCLGQIHN